MLNKYYVWNDKIQVLVTAHSPIEATAKALEYCGFNDSTDIPDHLISWPAFGVDQQGFRHINGSLVELAPTDIALGEDVQLIETPMWGIDKLVALDYFDNRNLNQYGDARYDEEL